MHTQQEQSGATQASHYPYRANRGGHAPGHLRDALIEALESSAYEEKYWWNLVEIYFYDDSRQRWWVWVDSKARAVWLLGQLWNCTDVVPGDICGIADLAAGSSYAQLVRKLKLELSELEYKNVGVSEA